jgi:hypothetical protein
MRKFLFPLLALVAASAHAQVVTNVIDTLGTTQTVLTYTESVTNTAATAAAIGGYRTLTLTSLAIENEAPISLSVSGSNRRLTLGTPPDVTAIFTITWGGLGGTNGLGGIDLIGGNSTPAQSGLKFNQRSADWPSTFTWRFTDTSAQTAVYNGNFPTNTTNSPQIPFDIALSSFTGSINWNSINFISFSGGGVNDLDLTLGATSVPFSIETTMMAPVPEPGTWAAAALLAGLAGFIHWRRRRANA